jgi:tartrate-resistant acid phosphatase type 5
VAGALLFAAMHLRLLPCAALFAFFSWDAPAEAVRFAAVGDYGVDNQDELAVANLVANFQPDFVVTSGDNNYLGAANIDRAIGKYYSAFIGSYTGAYGAGASSNRFFPALGNHEWENGYSAYINYFSLPGNERYYEIGRGPVHLFVLNSDANEPDGTSSTSIQARWLSNALRRSTAPWKIVTVHHPPFSSSMADPEMRWPFSEWGVALTIAGHAHSYERLTNGITHVVCGAGGAPLHAFTSASAGSVLQYDADHGAMRISATESNLVGEFWSVAGGGTVVDRFTLWTPPRLQISPSSGTIRVSWPTNNAPGFRLEASIGIPASTWTSVTNQPSDSAGVRMVTVPASGFPSRFFRLRR